MAKSRKLEELTASLNQIRPDPTSETASAVLQQVLSSKYSVAAQAAGIVAQAELYAFIPDLVDAFDRFPIKPKDTDPGCLAKQAIADTGVA